MEHICLEPVQSNSEEADAKLKCAKVATHILGFGTHRKKREHDDIESDKDEEGKEDEEDKDDKDKKDYEEENSACETNGEDYNNSNMSCASNALGLVVSTPTQPSTSTKVNQSKANKHGLHAEAEKMTEHPLD
ncbi:UNVERIFIED_CONTAM: hypothetical protein HDU68_003844 [Siphonaria sp. JEL0065]|nr:hypothetical protein HDU68_003844 [Siphonaria sp. JEL0065]